MPFLALLLALAVAGCALVPRVPWFLGWVAAGLNLAFAGLVTGYVFRTDPSFNGRSAWDIRVDAGEHGLYIAAMAVAALSAVLFGLLALRRTDGRPLRRALLVSGGVDFVLGWLIFFAFEID